MSVRPAESLGRAAAARSLARGHRDELNRRARRIRRTVAGFAAALFCAAFLTIYVQLASGHDPSLAARAHTSTAASAAASSSAGAGESASSAGSGGSSGGEATSSEQAGGGEASGGGGQEDPAASGSESTSETGSPLTTSQS